MAVGWFEPPSPVRCSTAWPPLRIYSERTKHLLGRYSYF